MRHKVTNALAILLLISVGYGCSFLRPKRPLTWHLILEVDAAAPDRPAVVQQTVAVIERRLDAFGVYNSEVIAQGSPPNGRILVSLPEVPDRKRLTELVTAGGLLEFVAVVSQPSPSPAQTYNAREEALASLGGELPPNRRVLPYLERSEQGSGATLRRNLGRSAKSLPLRSGFCRVLAIRRKTKCEK